MRRPLKPFVTEYKTSSRRQQPGFVEPAPAPADRSNATEAWPGAEAESSYEAALRAADALFSGHSQPRNGSQNLPADASGATTDETASAKPAGRILRVLDEAPPPQFAALEAAYAPKRRGRKPGSKNKPKVAPEVSMPEPTALPSIASAPIAPAAVVAAPATEAGHAEQPPRPAKKRTAQTPLRFGKRFSWARDDVRPGEAWKRRRLPRVCW